MNFEWIGRNADQIVSLTAAHAGLAVVPLLVSVVVSIPVGWWAHRKPGARRILLPATGVLYALPSLPVFIMLPLIIGTKILDPLNVVVALSLYGIALLVRTATDAFDSVGRATRDDAVAVGHSASQLFWQVALPMAGPPILAGVRVVSASTLSLVSVGALIGVPSLGYFFTDGYQRAFPTEIGVGIVGTAVLAVAFDAVLVLLGRLLMPWVRATDRTKA
ncbi:MAG: ABC transporter permease [Arachnia sp.]